MANDKIKVLYIAGWGRSGSTILGNILGEIDGFFHVGELRHMWGHGLQSNYLCGCGVPFRECEIWMAVFDRAFGGMDRISAHNMISLQEKGTRTHHIPLLLIPGGKPLLRKRLANYLAKLETLYRSIQSTTGCKVIVDSSKFPMYAYVLTMLPVIDLYILHLIRDSRAVAYSWLRKKPHADPGVYIERVKPFKSSLKWGIWNLAIPFIQKECPEKYLRLRYEDFIDSPQNAVSRIADLVREGASRLPFVSEDAVEFKTNHSSWGNPNRHETGIVKLRPDNEWRIKMKRRDRLIVTAMTWPLLLRYGYLAKTDTGH